MHVNLVFHHLCEFFSSGGGTRGELETESNLLCFSMKLHVAPRALRLWSHHGSRFGILPDGMVSNLTLGLTFIERHPSSWVGF